MALNTHRNSFQLIANYIHGKLYNFLVIYFIFSYPILAGDITEIILTLFLSLLRMLSDSFVF